MAIEDDARVRPRQTEDEHRRDAAWAAFQLSQRDYPPNNDSRSPPPWDESPPRVPQELAETDEERVARERKEFIAAADDTEIVDGGTSTTAYRRAIAVFDETDDRLQLGEHWYFRSAEFDKNGRF